jgi:hypothetical protein
MVFILAPNKNKSGHYLKIGFTYYSVGSRASLHISPFENIESSVTFN